MTDFFIPRKDLLEINCFSINSILFAPEGSPGRFSAMRFGILMQLLKENGIAGDAVENMLRESAAKCTKGIKFNPSKYELVYE